MILLLLTRRCSEAEIVCPLFSCSDSASNAGVYKSMYKAALQSSVEGNSGSTLLDQVRSTVESIRQLQPT